MPMLTNRLVHSLLGRARWSVAVVALALAGLSCGEAVVAPAVVKEVAVSGGGNPLRLAQSAQLGVALRGEGGVALPTVGVSWTSSDASVATVSASGQVTAVKRGTATISASAGGVTGTAPVPVIGVQRVDATPDSVAVIITQAAQLAASVTADPGVTVTPSWVSRDTTLATVTAAGRVTAKSVIGTTWVVATAEDQRDSVKVRVIPVPVASVAVTPAAWTLVAGQTVQLLATTKDSIGGLLAGRVITWTSSDTAKAVVGSGGLVTTKAAGAVTITATSEGKSAGAALTVLPPVSQVALSKDTLTIILGKTGTLTATPKAADGTTLDRAVSWSVLDTLIGAVTTDGVVSTNALVTARALGSTTVTATSEGKSTSAVLRVIPAPVATVTVTPATATLVMGKTLQLSAVPKDSAGNALGGRTVTWASSDSAKATVSAAGLVTARSTGVVTLTATSEGKSGTAELTLLIPVKTVTVTPADFTLLGTQTQQLTVVARDSLGNLLTRDVVYSSTNPLIASVSSTGLVAATGSGTVQILATVEGVSGSATVTAANGSGGTSSGSTIDTIQTRPTVAAYVSGDTGTVAFRPVDAGGLPVVVGATTSFVMGPVVPTNTNVTSTGGASCGTEGGCTQKLKVQGVAAGSAPAVVPLRIVATTGGGEGRVTAVVVGTVADSLAMRFLPASSVAVPTVAVGDTVTMEARLFYAGGVAAVPNVRFTLLTGSAGIAPCTVGWNATQVPGGCVKVVPSLQGTVKVAATLDKLGGAGAWADTLELTAGTVQVASITVTPTTVIVGAGQSSTLTAELKDAFDAVLTGRIVTWSTSDAAIATVSATGVVTGVKPGTTTVIAQAGTKTAVVTVNVVSAFNLHDQTIAIGGGWSGPFTCALDASGAAWCWGAGESGQLGTGIRQITATPERVVTDRRFSQIVASSNYACALDIEQDIYCWGDHPAGDATASTALITSNLPRQVATGKKWLTITAGGNSGGHVCGITTDNDAYCWGDNYAGQIGNGKSGNGGAPSPADEKAPFKVSDVKMQSIVASGYATCSLSLGGVAYCWGNNASKVPTPVIGDLRFAALAGGGNAVFCGQTESKAIWCWNNGNERWNFNNGSSFPAPLPFASIALTAVALGSNHACGMTATGDVYCWGNNSTGQLGAIEPRGQVTSPIKVPLPGTARGVTVAETGSASHSCAVLQSGQMYCWGSDNASGELGRGESSSSLNPIALASDPGFSDMQTQGMHSCGIKASNSRVYCWGNGSGFELGDGVGGSSSAPVEVLGGLTVTQLSVARHSTCVRTASAQAWCWPNQFGGYNLPTRFPIADPIAMISAGGTGSCALTSAGKIYCWGANDFGQLGNGQVNPCCSPTGPVLIQSSLTFAAIFAGAGPGGGSHACALTADGSAYCWGRNESGELGDGTQTNRSVPTAVIGGLKFTSLSTDFGGTCGVTVAKMVYCWGYQPWNRFTSASNVPQLYGPLKYNNFSLSYQNTCGIAEDGTAWCQGANEFGQVGVGSASMMVNNPVQVQSALRFAKIEPGIGFTCGLTSDSKTYCWGGNRNYALGRAVAVLEAVSGGTVYKGSR